MQRYANHYTEHSSCVYQHICSLITLSLAAPNTEVKYTFYHQTLHLLLGIMHARVAIERLKVLHDLLL